VPLAIDAAFVNRFVTSDNITSMLQDFRRGRPCEIDFINGAIVREAAALGVPVPVNAALTRLVKALDRFHAERPGP